MQNFLFFKGQKNYFKLRFSDILYLQAERRHTAIVTEHRVYICLTSISDIQKFLPKHLFGKVHRSYVASFAHIDAFDNEIIYIGNKKIPLGEQYKNGLKNAITIVNCDIRQYMLEHSDVDKLLRDMKP